MLKCPKCGKDMKAGFLQTGRPVAFNKERHKITLLPGDEEDILIANNAIRYNDFHGYICKECGLVLFDYKNAVSKIL